LSYRGKQKGSYGAQQRHGNGRSFGREKNSGNKWAQGVDLKKDALIDLGYQVHESDELRHHALKRSILKVGFVTTKRRLVFLKNVSNNPAIDKTVQSDLDWLDNDEPKFE